MRIMYDAVTPRNILNHTATPTMVAGYANGRYMWSAADWDLFPNAIKVRIAVRASYLDAHVLDCEIGDATPAECLPWSLKRREMGKTPIIYCNRSTWALVRPVFQNARVEEPLYWIATASGRAEYPSGSIGAQYLLDWQGVDVSAMADYIPGIDPEPTTFITGTGEDTDMSVTGEKFRGTPDNPTDYVMVPCDGKQQFFCAVGGSDHVDGHLYFIGNTSGINGSYTGDKPVHFDPDRPGPVIVPPNTRVVAFWVSEATHKYTAWCA